MFSSKIFYKYFSKKFGEYSSSKKEYLDSIDNIITNLHFKPTSIIDLGAGDGRRSLKMAKKLKVEDVILVDNCSEMFSDTIHTENIKKMVDDISDNNFYLRIDKKFDLILCLWNVLGHIETKESRMSVIKNISKIINDDGVCFLDINNRYNIKQYGIKNVLKNILRDIFLPNNKNGDFQFDFKNGDVNIKTQVHIFNPFEIDKYLKKNNIKIIDKKFIDYKTGRISSNVFFGQILYKIKRI
jgi:2-polyprenyl-3-methyl-5-hydroxy-6-metoxy-1,4-benzoquinol methylase